MTLTSRQLAVFVFLIMFGGIMGSSALGWWQTESTKVPASFTGGEFAGQANPADIRGSYTFGDISNSFDISPEVLAQAFQVKTEQPSSFAVKELEAHYLDSGFEIGTNSIRLFVAYYTGLPFDTTGQDIYLPIPASEILFEAVILKPDQLAYIQSHTIGILPAPAMENETRLEPIPADDQEVSASGEEEFVVKGKTIFGDLIRWGVSQESIEEVIGESMPDPAMKIKDYATSKGLDFETLRIELQTQLDTATR